MLSRRVQKSHVIIGMIHHVRVFLAVCFMFHGKGFCREISCPLELIELCPPPPLKIHDHVPLSQNTYEFLQSSSSSSSRFPHSPFYLFSYPFPRFSVPPLPLAAFPFSPFPFIRSSFRRSFTPHALLLSADRISS